MMIHQSYLPRAALLLFCICMPLLHNASPATAVAATTMTRGNETDRLALLAIKAQITSDPMLVTSSWNESLHFCQWHGVSCSHRHERVTVLNLSSSNLVGSISPFVGNLSFLRIINLSNNNIQGEIPSETGLLFRLQVLSFENNSLEGQIPASLSGCSSLRILALGNNRLIGKVPAELGSLSKLVGLQIISNKLTGMIPPSLGNLSSLQEFQTVDNMLEGSIPDSLGQLKGLTKLQLSSNDLSGIIPPSLYNLSSLVVLSVANNSLEGNLPHTLDLTLPNLQWLNIWGNQFNGAIPTSLSNASNLQYIDISYNTFSGGMPINFGNMKNLYWLGMTEIGIGKVDDLHFISTLGNCSKLRALLLARNKFAGVLPSSIANLSTVLEYFSIAKNEISGSIPMGIGNLVSMTALNMEYNQLEGSIPTSIGLLHNMQEMGFGKNKLSGEIPPSIGNLTLLNQLWLEKNSLQGAIPSTLGNCSSLFLLHLYGNNLSGNIPSEVIGLSSLTKSLNLAENELSGTLPFEVGNLKNLVELNISHNELSGEIPSSLGSCTSLGTLCLEYNTFEGDIPRSLSYLKGVEVLDLSHNNLSGEIPKALGTIKTLQKLNLSFNDLEGEVPVGGAFDNASAAAIFGNKRLCGGSPALKLPICSVDKPKKKKPPLVPILIPSVCGVILFSSLLICGWVVSQKKQQPSSMFSLVESLVMNISYQQLLKATDGFNSTNLIGTGGFGSVYRGTLDPTETSVAVKVLNLQNREASKSFTAECKVWRNIRHRNLVKILTACSSIDFHGNDFKALVYEFMPNGSLEIWLHSKDLNLLQQLNIAIDLASALDYLHNHCQKTVVHCDLKPSNILLDDDMTAKVSDFGLARFLKQQQDNQASQNQPSSSTSTSTSTSTIGIRGTIGYAAPEYGMGSEVSIHGDVYSYGIVLLEMFTGKKPTDSMFQDGLNLHNLVKKALPEGVTEIVDQRLLVGEEQEEANNASSNSGTQGTRQRVHQCLLSTFRVGVACSVEAPKERMNILDAAKELKLTKDLYFSSQACIK